MLKWRGAQLLAYCISRFSEVEVTTVTKIKWCTIHFITFRWVKWKLLKHPFDVHEDKNYKTYFAKRKMPWVFKLVPSSWKGPTYYYLVLHSSCKYVQIPTHHITHLYHGTQIDCKVGLTVRQIHLKKSFI